MAKNKRKKLGLQKEVSSIFKGVPIPQKNDGDNAQQLPNVPAAERTRNIPALERTGNIPEPERKGNIPAKPIFQEPQKSQISLIKKINQPTQLLRKDTPVKQLVVDTNKKDAGQGQWQQLRNKLLAPKPGSSSARQKATAAIIPVLAFVFILVLRQVFWTAPHKIEGAVKKDAPSIATVIDSSNKINWQIPAPYPRVVRDPMKLNSTDNEQTEMTEPERIVELNINGILYSEDNPSVLIGDLIAHEGAKISGVTIVKINKESVEFEIDGKKWERKVQR